MFPDDFKRQMIQVNGVELHVVSGGEGPPLFLLHGFPQSGVIWHGVAPQLARHYTVVIPDLRGYGDSSAPPSDTDHQSYSKRVMAKDIIALADHFSYESFALAGHDRGARVGYRLVLDHPGRVTRFCALDIIPTLDVWEQMDSAATVAQFHWSFLAARSPLPEEIIGQNPELFYRYLLERWTSDIDKLKPAARRAYLSQYGDRRKIHAQCEDYRAGATVDLVNDRADRDAGRKLDCPVLVLWSKGYLGGKTNSPLATWRRWADDVREVALDCGHFIVEEEPQTAVAALLDFFGENPLSID